MAFSRSSRLGRICVAPELCDLGRASDEKWTTMQRPEGRDYDFFATISMRDKLIGWAIIFTPVLAMLLLLKLCYRPEPIEPRYVYGCYASKVAPRLLIDARSISFDNSSISPTGYEVRAEKQGYSIYTKAKVILDRTTGGQFAFVTSSDGAWLPLLPKHYSDPRYLRHLSEFSGKFYAFSRQADEVVYSRITPKGACLTQPSVR